MGQHIIADACWAGSGITQIQWWKPFKVVAHSCMPMEYLCARVFVHMCTSDWRSHAGRELSSTHKSPSGAGSCQKKNITETFTGPVWITVGTRLSSFKKYNKCFSKILLPCCLCNLVWLQVSDLFLMVHTTKKLQKVTSIVIYNTAGSWAVGYENRHWKDGGGCIRERRVVSLFYAR